MLLPPYSPDFNPIKNAYAKFKSSLRKAAAGTVPVLEGAIADAFRSFTPNECANYFLAALRQLLALTEARPSALGS